MGPRARVERSTPGRKEYCNRRKKIEIMGIVAGKFVSLVTVNRGFFKSVEEKWSESNSGE